MQTTQLDKVIAALEQHSCQPRNSPSGWTSRCPAHEDRNPSLTIGEGRDGRVLLNCQAGCQPRAVVEALGLTWSDLFPPRENGNGAAIVATYPYHAADRTLVMEVVRKVPKTFVQRRPDGHGGWVWKGLPPDERVIYRLPEILSTIELDGGAIYMVEGEKDADRLWTLGAPATTSPGGAGKWLDRYADYLVGADLVVIVTDRDKTGYEHALAVAASLQRRGINHRIVASLIETPKADVSDHLDAGHSLDDLVEYDPSALEVPYTEPPPEAATAEAPPEPAFRLNLITTAEIAALPEPPLGDQLLGPLLVRRQRVVIGGHTGEGKTTLTLQLLKAACSGTETLGFEASERHKALIIDAEQGIYTIQRRIAEADLAGVDVTYAIHPDGLGLDQVPEHIDALNTELEASSYDIVVADPLYKLHRGESNEERAAVDLMRTFDAWRDRYGFCLVIPFHCRKPPPQNPGAKLTVHDIFGSNGYVRGAEVIIGIQRVRDGYSRLHWFKDRDGLIPAAVGTSWGLVFDRQGGGFKRDPHEAEGHQTVTDKVRYLLDSSSGWGITIEGLAAAGAGAPRSIKRALKEIGSEGKAGSDGVKLYYPPTVSQSPSQAPLYDNESDDPTEWDD